MASSDARERALELMREYQPNPTQATIEELRDNDNRLFSSMLPDDAIVEPVDADGIPALWVSVPGASTERTVVFYHGGGYFIGSKEGRRAVAAEISRTVDCRVLVPFYRLAPEHPFPAGLDDALVAYRWAVEQVGASSIVLSGDSAGGGLALAVVLAAREAGVPLPAGVAPFSPLVVFAQQSDGWQRNVADDEFVVPSLVEKAGIWYAGDTDPDHPMISPLRADLTGFPPLLLFAAAEENLVDDVVEFGEKARAAGVDTQVSVYEGTFHIWPLFSTIFPKGQQALEELGEFVRKRTVA